MEIVMTIYMSLLNLLAAPASIRNRLTTVGKHSDRSEIAKLRHRNNQAPPQTLALWERRLWTQTTRVRDLSPHLRRDIGLDM
jgi:hypothetical protein